MGQAIERVDLHHSTPIKHLSGVEEARRWPMKFISKPELLFLDEVTSGEGTDWEMMRLFRRMAD